MNSAASRVLPTPAGPRTVKRWHACSDTARSKAWRSASSSRPRPTSAVSSRRANAARFRIDRDQAVRRHRLAFALERERREGLGGDRAAHEPAHFRADEHGTRRGRLLEPGGDVDGVAGDERLAGAGHDFARVHADPAVEAVPGEGAADLGGGAKGPERVVLVQLRDPEDGHHGVAGELLDRAAVALENRPPLLEQPPDPGTQCFGVDRLAERGRADEVAEEDGDDLVRLAGCLGLER